MASRIKILSENLTNKIAAGEVVERPASAVKELVENALDAGATEIVVEIEVGGKRLIRVSDNGHGMSREDALLSLERHATSKILSDADLLSITTLGFRGEALPSLASVSRFKLMTKEHGAVEGTELYVEGGKVKEVKACGMAAGTIIEVRNLFFNTPARLKFMKTAETETGHVAEQVTRLALSRPDIRFTCLSDGKTVFKTVNGDLKDRIVALHGKSLGGGLYPVDTAGDGLRLFGLAGKPECSRASASHVYTFVNGRFVRDRVIQHAILQSYRRFLERGRYPVVVLFLDIPASDVDVNVHPTKHEVRFRSQAQVHDFIVASLETMLQGTPWMRKSPIEVPAVETRRYVSADSSSAEVREPITQYDSSLADPVETQGARTSDVSCSKSDEASECLNTGDQNRFFSSMTIIGQYCGAYVLCQDGEDMVLIDQHAAHERIAFERLKKQFDGGAVESQGLLFPEVIELTPAEGHHIRGFGPILQKLGYDLEEFGGSSRLLKSVPRILAALEYERTLRDVLGELSVLGRSRAFTDSLEDILMRIACHSVVRGVRQLTHREISELLVSLDSVEFASNCPHGRPVFYRITKADVEKMFKRG